MGKQYFEERREKRLFTYAIISDTHMRPEQGDESSPWEVNKYANDRARWVIDRITRASPDFVVHMGDIVHPFPHLSTYGFAADSALKAHNKINVPLYYLPGNHDVGDKKNPMMPADAVDEYGLEMYRKWFGPLHQSFDHKDLHFILINAQALNSGLAHENEHAVWLEEDFKANQGKRIHVFTHYPPYILDANEPNNYDNIDEPARTWFLELLEGYGVEALFAGHVHHFIYQKHGVTDCYNLFATSFVRQDYSEMFRVEAADEYGRNDAEKLGWCIVDVYGNTHIARIYRSNGATLKDNETSNPDVPKVQTYQTKDSIVAPVGVHLRHPWAEIIDLPYNGPLDEFIRKRVRNDYTLLGLWECGIRMLRVPLSDLLDEAIRSRMQALTEIGHRFSIFNCGIPSDSARKVLTQYHPLVNFIEIILPWQGFENMVTEIQKFRKEVAARLFLGNIQSSADQKHDGSKFSHYVSYGFLVNHTDPIEKFLNREKAADTADGFIFRVSALESPWDTIQRIEAYCKDKDLRAVVNVRLASENPAEYASDDVYVANRIAETMVAATASPCVEVFLDTFMDLDRGYFPRIGLYDRLYNRRLGSFVFSHLQGVINEYNQNISLGECRENSNGKTCLFESPKATFNLFLPSPGKKHPRDFALAGGTDLGKEGKARLIELDSGTISKIGWKKTGDEIGLVSPKASNVPSLLIFEH
jgi:predicted phosphodiesterase